MSDFDAVKKRKHETLAENALVAGDYAKAFFHTAWAAEFTFVLAEKSDGDVAKAYLDDANGLVEIAARLKEKLNGSKILCEERAVDGDILQKKWSVLCVNDISWDDVKGVKEAKAVINEYWFSSTGRLSGFVNCFLLHGPPGTGKTMLAKAIANKMDAVLMRVRPAQIKSKYIGETEANITEMFKAALSHKKCVLLLEPCEWLNKCYTKKAKSLIVNQFLMELLSMKINHQLLVLIETDSPWKLDDRIACNGHIGSAFVGLPEKETRRLIIDSALKNVPLAPDVDLDKLADLTEGYSGAEISCKENGGGVCDGARHFAARRWIERRKNYEGLEDALEPITWLDIETALANVVPYSKLCPDILKKNILWGNSYGAETGDMSS